VPKGDATANFNKFGGISVSIPAGSGIGISAPKVSTNAPDVNADAGGKGGVGGGFGISAPKMSANVPDVNADAGGKGGVGGGFGISAPKVSTNAPDVNADISGKGGVGGGFGISAPKVSTNAPGVSLGGDMEVPEMPDIDFSDVPEMDTPVSSKYP